MRFAVEFFVLQFAQFNENEGFSTTSYVQGQRSVCPKPRIPFFLFTSIGVQKQPVSVEVLAPTRLALQGSHVRRQYRKWTTLRSKSSTISGLFYAHWRSRCEAFVARKAHTIALSKAQRSCHKRSINQPIHEFGYPFGDSIPGLYCVAWLTQEIVSLRIFVKKKGMNPVKSNRRSQQKPLEKGGKGKIHR
jgi:hypothetical protein